MDKTVSRVLEERDARYGGFNAFAATSQSLKEVVKIGRSVVDRPYPLPSLQQEALDMILHKVARITTGDETYEDNWIDIAGYATLVANELQKPTEAEEK